jgi:glucose/mannose-6-phosphate isomerase
MTKFNLITSSYDGFMMLPTITSLIKQINYVLSDNQWKKFTLNLNTEKINKIIVVGMGSSLIAFKIIKAIFNDNLKIPIEVINDSKLPKWINKKTLILLSSYSGNSKEVIICAKKAIIKKINFIVITTGGKLLKITNNKSRFTFIIKKKFNYCQQPRMAIGYSLAIYLKIFLDLKLIKFNFNYFKKELKKIDKKIKTPHYRKKIFEIVKKIKNKSIEIISSDFLGANAELFFKQLYWNAKYSCNFHIIPEAMHYLFEGLEFPEYKKDKYIFIFFYSDKFNKEVKKDIKIAKQYLINKKINFIILNFSNNDKLIESIECLLMSSFVSFYLAMEMKIDPTPTPAISFYKSLLKY